MGPVFEVEVSQNNLNRLRSIMKSTFNFRKIRSGSGRGSSKLAKLCWIAFLLNFTWLQACSTTKSESPKVMQSEQGERAYQTGVAALEMWRYDVALAQFMDSLRWHQSVENAEGMLKALHAITATFQEKEDWNAALESIQTAVRLGQHPDSATGFSNPERWRPLWVESFWIRATILAQNGQPNEASKDLDVYIALLKEENLRSQDQKVANLRSFIALKENSPDRALNYARQAIQLGDTSNAETATAWQRLAEAQEALSDMESAETSWTTSLQLNRKLGRSDRIIAALEGLARVKQSQDKAEAAQQFSDRAETIRAALLRP